MAESPLFVILLVAGLVLALGALVVVGILVARAALPSRDSGHQMAAALADLALKVQRLEELPATWDRIVEEIGDQAKVIDRKARRIAASESKERRETEAVGPVTRDDHLRAGWAQYRGVGRAT